MYQFLWDRTVVGTNWISERLGFSHRGFGHEAQRTAGTHTMCEGNKSIIFCVLEEYFHSVKLVWKKFENSIAR